MKRHLPAPASVFGATTFETSRWWRGMCGAALWLTAMAPAGQALTLSDNLNQPEDGVELVTSTRWLASKILTDDRVLVLNQVILRLQQVLPGQVEAAVYTDDNGHPGQLVAVLNRTGRVPLLFPEEVSFGSGPATASAERDGTFSLKSFFARMPMTKALDISAFPTGTVTTTGTSPKGVELTPNSSFWIVTRAAGGRFASAYTDSEVGTGSGYTSTWAVSPNAGGLWSTRTLSPLFLGANAEAVTLEYRTDLEAILSTLFSGLPVAMVQRELIFRTDRTMVRDVNERLFRHRADLEASPGLWEVYASGNFGFGDVEHDYPQSGFQTETYVETVGVEIRPAKHLSFGLAVSGAESKFSFGTNNGGSHMNGIGVSAYASWATPNWYVDALYSYATYAHDLRRDTLFGHVATANPRSNSHLLQVNSGYNWHAGGFVTGPFLSVDYVRGDLDAYREHGGGTANLNVNNQNFDSLMTELGWQVSRPIACANGLRVIPQLRVSWRHEYLDGGEQVHASLRQSPFSIGSGNDFTPLGGFAADLETRRPADDYFTGGAGVALELGARWTAFASYQVTAGNNEFAHLFSLTGAFKF